MTQSPRKPGDPYGVGFARPPPDRRFQKGRSGNPRGRPKKRLEPHAEFMAVLAEKVTVKVQGVPQAMTIQRALLMRLREAALDGEAWAQKVSLRMAAQAPEPTAPEVPADEIAAKVLAVFKKVLRAKDPEAKDEQG
jgi:hypothetical protein